jgi:hypothetical protein
VTIEDAVVERQAEVDDGADGNIVLANDDDATGNCLEADDGGLAEVDDGLGDDRAEGAGVI